MRIHAFVPNKPNATSFYIHFFQRWVHGDFRRVTMKLMFRVEHCEPNNRGLCAVQRVSSSNHWCRLLYKRDRAGQSISIVANMVSKMEGFNLCYGCS